MRLKRGFKKMKIGRKGELSIQTLFFILMAFIFVWIIVFGFQKLFLVQDHLTNQEQLEIKSQLKAAFEYCEDPLNRDNFKIFKIKGSKFNSVCLLPTDPDEFISFLTSDDFIGVTFDQSIQSRLYNDVVNLIEGGDNVILFDTEFGKQGNLHVAKGYDLIDSFGVDATEEFCAFDLNGEGVIEFRVQC